MKLTQEQNLINKSILRLKQVGAIVANNNFDTHLKFTAGVTRGKLYISTGIFDFNGIQGKGLEQLLKHINDYKLKLNSY